MTTVEAFPTVGEGARIPCPPWCRLSHMNGDDECNGPLAEAPVYRSTHTGIEDCYLPDSLTVQPVRESDGAPVLVHMGSCHAGYYMTVEAAEMLVEALRVTIGTVRG